MEKHFLTETRCQVSNFGFQSLILPGLKGRGSEDVISVTDDDIRHELTHIRDDEYKIFWRFKPPQPNNIVTLTTYEEVDGVPSSEKVPEAEPDEQSELLPSPSAQPKPPVTYKSRLSDIFGKQKKRIEIYNSVREIRSQSLDHPELSGERVLLFDNAGCWARALGMIQKARQLRFELKVLLHDYYSRITGQGDGAIIAAALAAGISIDRLNEWWLTDWRKVHTPGIWRKVQRLAVTRVKRNLSGFHAGQARKALRKLFMNGRVVLRMKHVQTELFISAIQADMTITQHYSKTSPDIELWTVCEDSAVTKMIYAQKNTTEIGGVFLGALEKDDSLGLLLSENNEKMEKIEITSIGTPVKMNPPAAAALHKLDAEADKKALQSGAYFLYNKRVLQVVRLKQQINPLIRYHRLECQPMDFIVSNDTSQTAEQAGINSGYGKIFQEPSTDLKEEADALVTK